MAIPVLVNFLKVGDKVEILTNKDNWHLFIDRPIAIVDLEENIKEPMLIPLTDQNGQQAIYPKIVDKEEFTRTHRFVKLAEGESLSDNKDLVKMVVLNAGDPNGTGYWFPNNTDFEHLYRRKSTGRFEMIIPEKKPDENKAPAKPVKNVKSNTKETN